jgi:hypothetical protein
MEIVHIRFAIFLNCISRLIFSSVAIDVKVKINFESKSKSNQIFLQIESKSKSSQKFSIKSKSVLTLKVARIIKINDLNH